MKSSKKKKAARRPATKSSKAVTRDRKSAKGAKPQVIKRVITPTHAQNSAPPPKRGRIVRGGLIQMSNPINDAQAPVAKVYQAMLDNI